MLAGPFQSGLSQNMLIKKKKDNREFRFLIGIDAGLSFAYTPLSFTSNVYGKIAFLYKNKTSIGVTFGISHLKDTFIERSKAPINYKTTYSYDNLVWSASLFYRMTILKHLLFNAEPRLFYSRKVHAVKSQTYNNTTFDDERAVVPGLLFGAGYSDNTFLNIITNFYINYDFLQNRYSPYYKRVDFRFGFMLPL